MRKYFCEVCGRKYDGSHHNAQYCRKHECQLKKYGKFLDSNPRNKFDPNEFRFIGNDVVEFDTYDEVSCNVVATFKIDAKDYPIVSKFKWQHAPDRWGHMYAKSKNGLLHRLLLEAKPGQQVDHVNLDTTDNRRCNLRIADNSLNQSNRRPYNKIGIKGIEEHKNGKYSAYFRKANKQYHSPCYKTKEEAAFARFILEQWFRDEPLTQFSTDLINTLDIETKQKIVEGIRNKFNNS